MIAFFVSACVGKWRDFSFLLQGKHDNTEWQHWMTEIYKKLFSTQLKSLNPSAKF